MSTPETTPVVPRHYFQPGSVGDAEHQVACWAVLRGDRTVEDYALNPTSEEK